MDMETPMNDELIAAWNDLQQATAAMLAAPAPTWPSDAGDPVAVDSLRLRDIVQGRGMRFAAIWNANAKAIAAMVMADPVSYPEYHAKPAKGEIPNPAGYMQSMAIMPRIMAGTEGTGR